MARIASMTRKERPRKAGYESAKRTIRLLTSREIENVKSFLCVITPHFPSRGGRRENGTTSRVVRAPDSKLVGILCAGREGCQHKVTKLTPISRGAILCEQRCVFRSRIDSSGGGDLVSTGVLRPQRRAECSATRKIVE